MKPWFPKKLEICFLKIEKIIAKLLGEILLLQTLECGRDRLYLRHCMPYYNFSSYLQSISFVSSISKAIKESKVKICCAEQAL